MQRNLNCVESAINIQSSLKYTEVSFVRCVRFSR